MTLDQLKLMWHVFTHVAERKIEDKIEHINGAIGTMIGIHVGGINHIIHHVVTPELFYNIAQDCIKGVLVVLVTSATGFYFTKYLKKRTKDE